MKGGLKSSLYVPFKGTLKAAQKWEEKDIFDI